MKKIVIPTLILLYISANAGMFDNNTDIKKTYEFDTTTESKNEKMKEVLSRFQNSQVSEDEIQIYLESRKNSQVVPFSKDIEVDSELLREIDIKAREEKAWFYSSWFSDDANTSEEVEPTVESVSEKGWFSSWFGDDAKEEVLIVEEPTQEVNPIQGDSQ